jgi:ribonucleoside-diphosphate reductase beta chain
MNLLTKRVNYKPFEYPEVMTFIEAINKSFWVHSEVDFTADIQDFHSNLDEREKSAVKSALLAIAQIEVGVKTFWGNLYHHLPKPEFNGLGATFAECEFRHSEAYSRLLEVLGYNDDFEKLLEIPVFQNKLNLIERHLHKDQLLLSKLIFFTIVIENASLFSQFATILSFTRFKGYMKNVSNIIGWTSVDEQIHANAGIYIINKYLDESDVRNQGYSFMYLTEDIHKQCQQFLKVESELVDWIFRNGELDFFSKSDLINFQKDRVNQSLLGIGISPAFEVNKDKVKSMMWFEEEVFANSMDDFFAKRPVDYTKHDKSITENDLF